MIENHILQQVEKAKKLSDEKFNATAISTKISKKYNLVIWCDLDEDRNGERCFIVSIRENEFDEYFGDDIGIEYITNGTELSELEEIINREKFELNKKEQKQ